VQRRLVTTSRLPHRTDPYRTCSNADVAQAARRGDPDAFGELFIRLRPRAHRAAVASCGPVDADDAVAEGFTRAIVRIRQLQDPAAAERWLLRCVTRAGYDIARRRSRTWPSGVAPEDAHAIMPSAADDALRALDRRSLHEALETLPSPHRELLELRFGRELSVREVAVRLGLPEGTVRRRGVDARKALLAHFLALQLLPTTAECAPFTKLLCRAARDRLAARPRRRLAHHLRHCAGCRARRAALHELTPRRPSREADPARPASLTP